MAELRKQTALLKARTNRQRLVVANQLLQEGDMDVACLLLMRVAASRPRDAVAYAGMRRLAQLQEDARSELKKVDAMLRGTASASQSIPGALVPVGAGKDWEDRVIKAFQEYDRLAEKYRRLPVVGEQIAKHADRQRKQPTYAEVLNEGNAKKLWELGQRYEKQDHPCCAYLVYEEAANFAPAPSAKLAQERFAEMSKDPEIVAASKTCRDVQWCHEAYLRAEQWVEDQPSRAQALYRQIAQRAPEDSEIHRAARDRLAGLK
jgi:hypothetical protein